MIANWLILSIFDSYLPTTHQYFGFWMITRVNINDFSPNLLFSALILCRSVLELLIGSFFQFLTDLSACNMIVVGYYCLMFLFTRETTFVTFCLHPCTPDPSEKGLL